MNNPIVLFVLKTMIVIVAVPIIVKLGMWAYLLTHKRFFEREEENGKKG